MCPNCLGQSSSLSATLQLVGLFLLVPPMIFLAVVLAIRKLSRQADQSRLPSAPASGGGGGDQAG
jgi:hypothetical protein